jgi:hypothetical protein
VLDLSGGPVQAERPHERGGVVRHRRDPDGGRAGRGADAGTVEEDDVVVAGEQVDEQRVPQVDRASEALDEEQRPAPADPAVGEIHGLPGGHPDGHPPQGARRVGDDAGSQDGAGPEPAEAAPAGPARTSGAAAPAAEATTAVRSAVRRDRRA